MSDQLALPPEPAAMPTVDWWIARNGIEAHAFYDRPGFPRSVCRAQAWTVQWERAADDDPRCPDCEAGIAANGAAA